MTGEFCAYGNKVTRIQFIEFALLTLIYKPQNSQKITTHNTFPIAQFPVDPSSKHLAKDGGSIFLPNVGEFLSASSASSP
jgi:hypothetical protein